MSTFTMSSNRTHLMGYIPSRPRLGPFLALVQFFIGFSEETIGACQSPWKAAEEKAMAFFFLPIPISYSPRHYTVESWSTPSILRRNE